MEQSKKCKECSITKPLEEFNKEKSNTVDGRRAVCKECRKVWKRNYRKTDTYYKSRDEYSQSESYKTSQRVYAESDKGKISATNRAATYRAKKRDASIDTTKEEFYLISCVYAFCYFKSTTTGVAHHVDHIIPLSKGGKHHPSNLQIITAEENWSKGSKLL